MEEQIIEPNVTISTNPDESTPAAETKIPVVDSPSVEVSTDTEKTGEELGELGLTDSITIEPTMVDTVESTTEDTQESPIIEESSKTQESVTREPKKSYQPTHEDYQKAEDLMSDIQREYSEAARQQQEKLHELGVNGQLFYNSSVIYGQLNGRMIWVVGPKNSEDDFFGLVGTPVEMNADRDETQRRMSGDATMDSPNSAREAIMISAVSAEKLWKRYIAVAKILDEERFIKRELEIKEQQAMKDIPEQDRDKLRGLL